MKIVYRANNLVDANLVKAALADAGVRAFVAGEYLTGAVGPLLAWDVVTVMVAETDVERAAPIVAEIDAALRENREPTGAGEDVRDPVPRPT